MDNKILYKWGFCPLGWYTLGRGESKHFSSVMLVVLQIYIVHKWIDDDDDV